MSERFGMIHKQVAQIARILPEPVLLAGAGGDIKFANEAAGELAGIPPADLVSRRLHEFLLDPPERVDRYLRLCSRTRHLSPGAMVWKTRQGNPLDMRCDGGLVQGRDEAGGVLIFLRFRERVEATGQFILLNQKIDALSREIVERKKAEAQRDALLESERQARTAVERVSRTKDEFLATLSHELRTPLNAILGWAQVLRQDVPVDSELEKGLAVIERNARVQAQLIEELLDMSRIISGRLRLEMQMVDLSKVIEAAIEAVRPSAQAKHLHLQALLDPLAGPVYGDPNRLQQVAWNLLSNAVKFTPAQGRVLVTLEPGESHIQLTVSDTGPGIDPEFLPHLFERFRQADASTRRQHGGLGLGLSIVKQLIELHGGSIRVLSPGNGEGTRFIVSLPRPASMQVHEASLNPATRSGRAAAAAPASLAGLTVLVVDDEPDARELIARVLSDARANVITASSAEQALQRLNEQPPDVLISDISMPQRDGYDLIREIRARETGRRLPALALTAFARSEDRERSLLAGYQMHLPKPVETSTLATIVASLAGRGNGELITP